MRVIGPILLALLASLSFVSSVSAQDSALLLSTVNLSSVSVTEGRSVEGTVTLNMPAPGDGAQVSLVDDPPWATADRLFKPNSADPRRAARRGLQGPRV